MKTSGITRLFCSLLLTFAVSAAFGQGLYWESTTTVPQAGGKVTNGKNYAMPKMFKFEDEGSTIIVRLDREKIYTANHTKKTYTEMTFAEMEEFAGKMKSQMGGMNAQLEEKLKNLPPDQRKMMEERMSAFMPKTGTDQKVDLKATGDQKTIGGHPCKRYSAVRGDKELASFWIASDVHGFDNMKKDWLEFSKRMASLSPMSSLADAYQKIDGFPMETDMSGGVTSVVTKLEARSTPAGEFEVPSGYTKTTLDQMGAPGK
ncbi:MAG TPA: DUF4412 domain-containing protein [Bacteroidota bacterium]|nr:DUF4412 domain-containing protein [Bacteroidota bacterium]